MTTPLTIIADGDSWNSYPKLLMTGGGLADHLSSVLGIYITNYANPGDSTEETMGLLKRQRLQDNLPEADILLFSGGGDDICGDQFIIWLNPNLDGDISKAVNYNRLSSVLDLVIADYEDLADLRNRVNPNCLIVTHSYDFPAPLTMGVGVMCLGPWLQPGLIKQGWTNVEDQAAITKLILTQFQARMAAFAATQTRWLHVNTQGTMSPADWGNEIHPNGAGWTKIAQVINLALLPWLDQIAKEKAAS